MPWLKPSNHAGLRYKVGRFYDQGRGNPSFVQALADVLGNEIQGNTETVLAKRMKRSLIYQSL